MKDDLTLSCINLYAVLHNMENLCAMDTEAKSIISGKNLSISFNVRNGPKATLIFNDGKCSFHRGLHPSDIRLYFSSPSHLNSMFEGKSNPIPTKGFTKIGFLKNEFTRLVDRLSYYLKPTDNLLENPDYFLLNTVFSLNTAINSIVEIANNDKIGNLHGKRMPDGVLAVTIADGSLSLYVAASNGELSICKAADPKPRAVMEFDSIVTANALLNGKVDAYTCIATEGIKTKGYVPMLDCFDKLLGMVPIYLK